MNTKKQYPNDKLQKSSLLFLQLGLVLSLFIVYHTLELKTIKKSFVITYNDPSESEIIIETIPLHIPKSIKKPLEQKIKKQKLLTEFTPISDDTPTITNIIKPESNPSSLDSIIEILPDGDSTPEDIPNDIDFIAIEEAPIFPGCEGLEKEESKKCFTKAVSKFVNRKFNSEIAEDLNLIGKHKIWVLFKIDKHGNVVNIRANASHKSLEKEAIRVVEKLPQMIPGKQQTKPVGVKYALPIAFIIN